MEETLAVGAAPMRVKLRVGWESAYQDGVIVYGNQDTGLWRVRLRTEL